MMDPPGIVSREKDIEVRIMNLRRGLLLLLLLALTVSSSKPAPRLEPITAEQMKDLLRQNRGHVVWVHVWATWCAPCREEFPALMRVYRKVARRGVRLVLISADFDNLREDVEIFLAQQGVDFVTYLQHDEDTKFVNTLSDKWSGAIPANFIFGPDGRLREFWEGESDEARFLDALERVLRRWKG